LDNEIITIRVKNNKIPPVIKMRIKTDKGVYVLEYKLKTTLDSRGSFWE